jgi:hypothetical protein
MGFAIESNLENNVDRLVLAVAPQSSWLRVQNGAGFREMTAADSVNSLSMAKEIPQHFERKHSWMIIRP